MDTKKLHQKILDLAIRGKLVPQDPNDEPASVLLERIKAEKERLIKEGKIKRNKKENTSDKSPYQNLPENWAICKLSDIASFGGGKTPSTVNRDFWDEGSHLWVTSKDMKHSIIEDSLVKISDIGAAGMQIFPPLTILMVVRSGILRRTLPIAILKKKSTINQDLKAICLYDTSIVDFIFWSLKANEQSILDIYQKDGTTVESINFEKFQDIAIPLPPLPEQHRIVSVIESSFALIDEIEANKLSLEQFIKQAKSKVLDLAIHGKLVPQDPNEEPASVLLERIKKEQKASKIASDISHYPFEIPSNWAWCELGKICIQVTDGTHRTPNYKEIGIPFLRVTDITESNGSKKFISEKEHNELIKRCKPEKGDVLLSKNGTIGIAKVVDWDYDFSIFVSLCLLKPQVYALNNKYLAFYLNSNSALKQMKARGKTVTVTNLHLEEIKQLKIPLPPLPEQKRIVSKIDEIFTQLDEMEKALKA